MTLTDGIEYLVPSTSCMMALCQMKAIEQGSHRKIYSPFFPTAHQMSNMVRGERATYNLASILYPQRDNIVRVGPGLTRVIMWSGVPTLRRS